MTETRGTKLPARTQWWVCPVLGKDTVYLCANGPSLRDAPLDALRGKFCIAVNSALRLVPWARMLFFGDARWWWLNREWAAQIPTEYRVTLSRYFVEDGGNRREEPCDNEPGILCVRQKGTGGLCRGTDSLAWLLSSGGTAINLAVHANAGRRIVLLGYDFRRAEDGCRNAVANVNPCSDKFAEMLTPSVWMRTADEARYRGIEILNATPDSALDVFPRVKLGDVL
jgi:hypothetical protein